MYTVVMIWFAIISFIHRKDLMGLQKLVLIFLCVAWFENLIWGCDYVVYNNTGVISDVVNVFGSLFTSLKSTLIRTTLLLCALGYSITKPLLRKAVIVGVVVLTIGYFIAMAITQYLLVAQAAGAYISSPVELLFEIILIFFNVAFGVWIIIALFIEMRSLKADYQSEKYSLYVRLTILLIVCAIIAIIFFVAQAATTFADWEDQSFRVWWLWDTYWEFFYFTIAFAIAIIWRPSEHNLDYAYSEQLPSDDISPRPAEKNEGVMLEESEKPGNKNKPTAKKDDSSSSYELDSRDSK